MFPVATIMRPLLSLMRASTIALPQSMRRMYSSLFRSHRSITPSVDAESRIEYALENARMATLVRCPNNVTLGCSSTVSEVTRARQAETVPSSDAVNSVSGAVNLAVSTGRL